MIDQENHEDNVDYETSVRRLLHLTILLALISATLATSMVSILLNQWSHQTVFKSQQLKKGPTVLFVPHLVLLFQDGSMEIYGFNSDRTQLDHAWSFKAPASGYMLSNFYFKRRYLHFLYGWKKGHNSCYYKWWQIKESDTLHY